MEDEMREEINEEVIKEEVIGETNPMDLEEINKETIANGEEEIPAEEIKGE